MKRCSQCRRDYYDDSLVYCLDDGARLLDGPAASGEETAVLHIHDLPTEASIPAALLTNQAAIRPTLPMAAQTGNWRTRRRWWLPAVLVTAAVVAAGVGLYAYFGRPHKIESIAVMPFANESGAADLEYLSDGLTETLIGTLSQIPSLNVRARSSVFRYKGKEISPREIGNELNVQAVLNGTVIQRGPDLVLNVELIDASNERVIWSKSYIRKEADLPTLQSEIAREVSQELQAKISAPDQRRLEKKYTENAEAYTLYLRGRFDWNKRTPRDILKAIEFFDQAIEKDPGYALAYAGIADACALFPTYSGQPPKDWLPRAHEAALKALQLDEELSEAHASLGQILEIYYYDFAGAEREFKRAIELNPNYAPAYQWYGELLSHLGRRDESFAEFQRALEIEPFSLTINRFFSESLIFARRYDDALAQTQKTLELEPSFGIARYHLAIIYMLQGKNAEGLEEYLKVTEYLGYPEVAAKVRERAKREGWESALRMSFTPGERSPTLTAYVQATLLVVLGDNDEAIALLNKAYEDREAFVAQMKVDPRLDPLRGDPRFEELIKKIGFPE